MIVRTFLKWYESAPVDERCEAVRMLAEAYLAGEIGSDTPQDVETALTLVLDDPSMAVRRELAWVLTSSERAPRHILIALAHDHIDVAALVLARSPQMRDADLIDSLRHRDALAQLAVAMRDEISAKVAGVIADMANEEAVLALLGNPGAALTPVIFEQIANRFADVPRLREALVCRPDLPVPIRQRLVASVSDTLLGFLRTTGWVDEGRAIRVVGDSREAATIDLSERCADLGAYIEHLRTSGQLTPSVLLRSLLCGQTALMGAALTTLSGIAPRRVAGLLSGRSMGPFAAAYLKAGLPKAYLPAFAAAIEAVRDLPDVEFSGQTLRRSVINRVMAACLAEDEDEMRPVIALLRRYEADVARAEARMLAERLKQTQDALVLDADPLAVAPVMLDADNDGVLTEGEVFAFAEYPPGDDHLAGDDDMSGVEAMTTLETPEPDLIEPLPILAADAVVDIVPPEPHLTLFEQRLRQIARGTANPVVHSVLSDVAHALVSDAVTEARTESVSSPVQRLPSDIEALFARAFGSSDISESERAFAAADVDPFQGWELRRSAA